MRALYVEGDLPRPQGMPLADWDHLCAAAAQRWEAAQYHCDHSRYHALSRSRRDQDHLHFSDQPRAEDACALIKGYAGTLRRDDATWDRSVVQDSLAVIEEEADHLTELIENLLDASRLQAGALKINLADVSLGNLGEKDCRAFPHANQQARICGGYGSRFSGRCSEMRTGWSRCSTTCCRMRSSIRLRGVRSALAGR